LIILYAKDGKSQCRHPYNEQTEQPPVWKNCQWVVNPLPPIQPHRVSKDTITSRILQANKLNDLILLIDSLPTDQKFLWNNFSWFWSNNQTIISMCQQIGLDPNTILEKDPYI
jgi:hypothetical protein